MSYSHISIRYILGHNNIEVDRSMTKGIEMWKGVSHHNLTSGLGRNFIFIVYLDEGDKIV